MAQAGALSLLSAWLRKQTDFVAAVKLLTAHPNWRAALGSGIRASTGHMNGAFLALCAFLRIVPFKPDSKLRDFRDISLGAGPYAKAGCKAVIRTLEALEAKVQEEGAVLEPQMIWDASESAICEVNKSSSYLLRPQSHVRQSWREGGSSDLDEDTNLAYAIVLVKDADRLVPKVNQGEVGTALCINKGDWSGYLNGKSKSFPVIERKLQKLRDEGDAVREAFLLQAKKQRQAHLHQKHQQPPKAKRKSGAATTTDSASKKKTQVHGQVAFLAGQQLDAHSHSLVLSGHTRHVLVPAQFQRH
jgi:hypothetical protein